MKMWTIEEEAEQLSKRFHGVNRAAFARDFQVSGGQAMIYQHITGRRPINLEAAQSYARGFKCTLEEISPRLATQARKALSLAEDAGGVPADDVFTKEQKEILSMIYSIDKESREAWLKIGRALSQAAHIQQTYVRSLETEPGEVVKSAQDKQEGMPWTNAGFRRFRIPESPKIGKVSTHQPVTGKPKKGKK